MKRIFVKYSSLVLLVVFANLTGCGVKGNPVILPDVKDTAPIISNFKADSNDSAIILNWDFYSTNSKINHIAIEKSELGSAGNECKECPRTFELIGQVSVKDAKKENKEYIKFSFTDNKVQQGKTYDYRLLICDVYNDCRESIALEINLK